jgi:hypothetical protein
MSENKTKVISSIKEGVEAIQREKEKKEKALKAIFEDNSTGRYSGPTDN